MIHSNKNYFHSTETEKYVNKFIKFTKIVIKYYWQILKMTAIYIAVLTEVDSIFNGQYGWRPDP